MTGDHGSSTSRDACCMRVREGILQLDSPRTPVRPLRHCTCTWLLLEATISVERGWLVMQSEDMGLMIHGCFLSWHWTIDDWCLISFLFSLWRMLYAFLNLIVPFRTFRQGCSFSKFSGRHVSSSNCSSSISLFF